MTAPGDTLRTAYEGEHWRGKGTEETGTAELPDKSIV